MVAHLAVPLSLELSAVEFGFTEVRAFELRSIELLVGLELEVAA